jgi:hypothetical protein
MRLWPILLVLGAVAAVGTAAAAAPDSRALPAAPLHRGAAYFAVACGFSHRNQDDPIVHFGHPGLSHDHTYFGNTSTNASSTPASLRAAGRTTCRLRADTAAYWAPTLFAAGRAVEPVGAVVYYVRRTVEPVRAFPAGLEMIAGNAAARSAQGRQVTFWSCGREVSSTVPACSLGRTTSSVGGGRRSSLRLQVNFPNCWDGSRLDSADHQSHLAYSVDGVCAESHPVEVPAISLVIYYGIAGASSIELASGGQFSAHADFVNAWDQRTLEALVDRYLNRVGRRGRGH